jgi:hypothetical protein
MSESHSHYSVPVQSTEAQLSPADRQRQSEELHRPGKVRVTVGGEVKYEQVQEHNSARPANEDRSDWFNHATAEDGSTVDLFAPGMNPAKTYIPIRNADGSWDRTPLASAISQKLVKKDGSGRWLPFGPFGNPESPAGERAQDDPQNKPAEKQQKDQQDDQPARWESPLVDQITSVYAPELGADTMQALVARAVTLGEAELPDHVAASLAQRIDTATPENMREAYRVAYAEAVQHANAMIEAVGVRDLNSFIEYAETKQRGEYNEARYKFAEGDGRALQQMARQYLAKFPDAAVAPETIDAVMAEGNTVNGGRLHRNNQGTACVTFDSGETMTLASALSRGFVRISA